MQGVRGNGQTRGKVERTAQTLSELPERPRGVCAW